jgi:hypothetical protein
MQQITVLVPNHLGIAAEITCALAERQINIMEIDVNAIDDHGVIVLTVDRYDEALKVLRDHGFQAVTQDAILIKLVDKSGALASIAVRLRDANLDLRSMHIIRRDEGTALVSLVSSDNAKASQVLADVLVVDTTAR